MADLNKIIDELSKLTVVEAAELSKQLEEKWGVTAAAAVAAVLAASDGVHLHNDVVEVLDVALPLDRHGCVGGC